MVYEKQRFIDNETVLSAKHLDHIENGIVANEKLIEEVDKKIPQSVGVLENDVGYLTQQNLEPYSKTVDNDAKYQAKGKYAPLTHEHTQYLTEHQSLENYYGKHETYSKLEVDGLMYKGVHIYPYDGIIDLESDNTGLIYEVFEGAKKDDFVLLTDGSLWLIEENQDIQLRVSYYGTFATNVDLTNYYNKQESDNKYQPKGNYLYIEGENIKIENNVISVITTDLAESDNTKPITSSGVHTIVGNIDTLLNTI